MTESTIERRVNVEVQDLANELSGGAKPLSPRAKALLFAKLAVDFKALDVVVLDVTGLSSFADFFVICSGKSSRQVQGIAENLQERLRETGIRPLGVEGLREGQWVLLDYGDVILHVFYEPVRLLYDLESLWSEAVKLRCDHESLPEGTLVP